MEVAIMNMHQKMKNLESKYIDLANFYKKEMIDKSTPEPAKFKRGNYTK